MMKRNLILIGGGGHCKACIDVIEQHFRYQIAGIVDKPENLHIKIMGYEIIATDDDLPRLAKEFSYFIITLGQIKSPDRRIALFQTLKNLKVKFASIISPLAYVSKHAQVGEGTIVMHHALVNAGASIGRNCIINTKALVEHDAVVEDHCHIATSAVINGGVRVGRGTFSGSNSVTRESIEIGNNCIVGAGKSVQNNLPPHTVFKGR